jgi:hypothetical protein
VLKHEELPQPNAQLTWPAFTGTRHQVSGRDRVSGTHRLAAGERIDPDRISFIKILKHVRRSVIRQSAQTSVQTKQLMATMTAKVRRPTRRVAAKVLTLHPAIVRR